MPGMWSATDQSPPDAGNDWLLLPRKLCALSFTQATLMDATRWMVGDFSSQPDVAWISSFQRVMAPSSSSQSSFPLYPRDCAEDFANQRLAGTKTCLSARHKRPDRQFGKHDEGPAKI